MVFHNMTLTYLANPLFLGIEDFILILFFLSLVNSLGPLFLSFCPENKGYSSRIGSCFRWHS